MRRIENAELVNKIMKHLADKYKMFETREPNHLSTYVYCLTKAFLEQKQVTEPSQEEVMLFAIGLGLQDIFTPKEAATPIYNRDGIIYRPDMSFMLPGIEQLVELKTTRKSAKYHFSDDFLPETWKTYIMGGCWMRDTNSYDLVVFYLMGNYAPPMPQMYADRLVFDREELITNWQWIMGRKKVLDNALATRTIPAPTEYCHNWECRFCRNKMVCQTLVMAQGGKNAEAEVDKSLWQ